MDSREVVFRALRHEETDRVPFNTRPCEEMRARLRSENKGINSDFERYFQHDIHYVRITLPKPPENVQPEEWLPVPSDTQIADCKTQVSALHALGLAVCNGYTPGLYEQVKAWFGDEQTLTMPFDDPGKLEKALECIMAWKLGLWKTYAQSGVDILWIGDDLGTQKNLVMSPEHYRKWYRPCHVNVVREIRRINPQIKIAFHCCGYVTTLLPDLIDEVGIDILEAVQSECMDLAGLKRDFGRDLTFWGAIGNQSVLSCRTPKETMEGVLRTLEIMAPGGGYIAAPCHTLTPDIPWENLLAFYEAVRSFSHSK